MAKPQCLVFIPRHKGLNILKFGSVHWLRSWMCSFSTGLAQINWAALWPSTFLLYQPGLDSGCPSAKLDHSIPQTNQSVCQGVTVQNLPGCTVFPGVVPFLLFPPHATCHCFLYFSTDMYPCFRLRPALQNASTTLKSFLAGRQGEQMSSSSPPWTCVTRSWCYRCASSAPLIAPCCSITHFTMKCQVLPSSPSASLFFLKPDC